MSMKHAVHFSKILKLVKWWESKKSWSEAGGATLISLGLSSFLPTTYVYLSNLIFNSCFWPLLPFYYISCFSQVENALYRHGHWDQTERTLSFPHCCYVFTNLSFFPATGPGNEPSLWGPQLRVHIQGFPFPFSGQFRASRLADANMLQITQPQLPESHPGWLFPRRRHSIHGLRMLTTSHWHDCPHLQHQHWWVSRPKTVNKLNFDLKPYKVRKWKLFDVAVLHVAKLSASLFLFVI